MLKPFLVLISLPFFALSVLAQETTTVIACRNPSRMMMLVTGPVLVCDSTTFLVRSVEPLPRMVEADDSLHFACTILAQDGKTHSTKVSYVTSSGIQSLDITMLAPFLECSVRGSRVMELGNPHPNPTADLFRVTIENYEPGAVLDFYSLQHGSMFTIPICSEGEVDVSTRTFPRGTYFLRLRAGLVERGQAVVVVEH